MKAVLSLLLILSIVFAINGKYLEGHDGRPGCKTDEEMKIEFWRNNNDPITYWVCSTLNVPATPVYCPPQTAFLQSARQCVTWNQWQWEEPINPPSMIN